MADNQQQPWPGLPGKPSPEEPGSTPEAPKKYCFYCESESSTWAFCDQCGRLFWGRIAWDLACGGVCVVLGAGMVVKPEAEIYERVLAVLIGAAGLWVTARIVRQLIKYYLFWKGR